MSEIRTRTCKSDGLATEGFEPVRILYQCAVGIACVPFNFVACVSAAIGRSARVPLRMWQWHTTDLWDSDGLVPRYCRRHSSLFVSALC